jgi:hypothetical protein
MQRGLGGQGTPGSQGSGLLAQPRWMRRELAQAATSLLRAPTCTLL